MPLENWEHLFKPEVRNSGRTFVGRGQVALMRPSDTEAQAYIRTSTSFKVMFRSSSLDSPILTATCTCPQAKKGQFCKHMWAVLVELDEKNPDFFSGKTDLQTKTSDNTHRATSQAQADSQAAYKIKQTEYRKQQYQLQKERAQKYKNKKNGKSSPSPDFPSDVEAALAYF